MFKVCHQVFVCTLFVQELLYPRERRGIYNYVEIYTKSYMCLSAIEKSSAFQQK